MNNADDLSPAICERIERLLTGLAAYEPEQVYLFGSAARGEADELSDLDVVVVKRTPIPFFERLQGVARLLPSGVGAVDLFVYTPDEFARMRDEGNVFIEMILEEGRLIGGKQPAD